MERSEAGAPATIVLPFPDMRDREPELVTLSGRRVGERRRGCGLVGPGHAGPLEHAHGADVGIDRRRRPSRAPAATVDPSAGDRDRLPERVGRPADGDVPVSVAVGVVIVPVQPPAGCSNTKTLPSPETIPTVARRRADGNRLRVGAQRNRRARTPRRSHRVSRATRVAPCSQRPDLATNTSTAPGGLIAAGVVTARPRPSCPGRRSRTLRGPRRYRSSGRRTSRPG